MDLLRSDTNIRRQLLKPKLTCSLYAVPRILSLCTLEKDIDLISRIYFVTLYLVLQTTCSLLSYCQWSSHWLVTTSTDSLLLPKYVVLPFSPKKLNLTRCVAQFSQVSQWEFVE
jgi:hypothetical protein